MNVKRLAIGSIVGTIVLYLLGMLIWQMLFAGFFDANRGSAMGVDRAEPVIWAIVVGSLLYAILITYVLESGSGSKTIVDGLKIGVLVGILLWGTTDFIQFGVTNLRTLTGVIADTLLEGARAGISGAVIAAVLGKVGD